MQGCVQRVWFSDVNAATVRVLAAEGYEVHTKAQPRCCGALIMHSGVEDEALALARETIAAFEGYDAIVANVAGCGSAMKDYGHFLADDPEWAERAKAFSAKVRDVHEVLAEHEPRAAAPPARAQGRLPRRLPPRPRPGRPPAAARRCCASIPGLELVEPAEWELCCGSAGIYNVMQPEAAEKLGRAQGRQPAGDRRPGHRRRQPGLHDADRRPPRRRRDPASCTPSSCSTARSAARPPRRSCGELHDTGRHRGHAAPRPAVRRHRLDRRAALRRRPAPAASSRGGRSCSPPAASATAPCAPAGRSTSWPRRGRSARATGASRRRPTTSRTAASRSPARPTASSSINALNSGASTFMADFEDANTPTWRTSSRASAT